MVGAADPPPEQPVSRVAATSTATRGRVGPCQRIECLLSVVRSTVTPPTTSHEARRGPFLQVQEATISRAECDEADVPRRQPPHENREGVRVRRQGDARRLDQGAAAAHARETCLSSACPAAECVERSRSLRCGRGSSAGRRAASAVWRTPYHRGRQGRNGHGRGPFSAGPLQGCDTRFARCSRARSGSAHEACTVVSTKRVRGVAQR